MRFGSVLLILIVFALTACNRPAASSEGSDLSKIKGDWVVIGDTSGRGDSGTLSIHPDGKFDMTYQMGTTGAKKESDSGTYQISHQTMQESDLLTVAFSSPKLKNKSNPTGVMMQLYFDPNYNILQDFLTVMYARPNEAKKVQAQMDELRKKK